jgi:hypothetical protein
VTPAGIVNSAITTHASYARLGHSYIATVEESFAKMVEFVARMMRTKAWFAGTGIRPRGAGVTVGSQSNDTFTTRVLKDATSIYYIGEKVYYTTCGLVRPGMYRAASDILESVVMYRDGRDMSLSDPNAIAAWVYSASTTGNNVTQIVEGYRSRSTPYIMTVPIVCDAHHRVYGQSVRGDMLITKVPSGGLSTTYRDTLYTEQQLDGAGRMIPIGRLALAGWFLSGIEPPLVSIYSPRLLGWVGLFSLPRFEDAVEWSAQTILTSSAPCIRWFGRALAYMPLLPLETRYAVRTLECMTRGMEAAPHGADWDGVDKGDFRVAVSGHVISQFVLSHAFGFPRQMHIAIRAANLKGGPKARLFPLLEERGSVGPDALWHSALDDVIALFVGLRLTGATLSSIRGDLNLIVSLAEKYPQYLQESALTESSGRSPTLTSIGRVRQLACVEGRC